jgi:DegV family protein with EDD domain
MTTIKIVTDSTVALTPEEREKYDITIVPLTIQIDGTVYEDGVTLDREEFLDLMANSKSLPTSSQPAIGKFVDVYDALYAQDPDVEIISVHLSSGLSGTIHAAEQAAQLTKAKVTTFDSLTTDRGQAFIVLEAVKMAQAGASVDEIMDKMIFVREHQHVYLSFTSLKNMVAGGRLGKAAGTIGGLLNIKIGATVDDEGKVEVVMKGRGMKSIEKFHEEIITEMQQYKEMISIEVAHAGIPEVADKMADRMRSLFPEAEVVSMTTTPVISTHTGVGVLAILFYAI